MSSMDVSAIPVRTELDINGTIYKFQKIPGFRFIKVYGAGNKATTDMYRDMIEAGVEEPKMSIPVIEKLDYEVFVILAQTIIDNHDNALKNLKAQTEPATSSS